jgi:putative membrane protein
MAKTRSRWFRPLAAAFAVAWTVLAIAPQDRPTWALENLLTVVFAATLAMTRNRLPFSRVSNLCFFVFLLLHSVGAHYTYAEVPYDDAIARVTGWSPQETFGWERNNYDRLVHFAFGLLLAYPTREVVLRMANARGFWGYFVPFMSVVAGSSVFELLEWFAAALFGGALGMTYLGTQGDEWDAQKDVALATLGALVAMTATAMVNRRLQRDFAREWITSLRGDRRPLGEESVREGRPA